jgi:hypothetical protein
MNTNIKYQNNTNYYLRVLAAYNPGLAYINKLPKATKAKIITTFKNKENDELVNIEVQATKIYGLITKQPNIYLDEYKMPIIGGRNDN